MTIETQKRKVTADFITEILSLPQWKSHTERVVVYANLVARLTPTDEEGHTHLAHTHAIAKYALRRHAVSKQAMKPEEADQEDAGLYEAVFRCNKAVHRLTDEDGDYIWNDDGVLCDKWERDQTDEAIALLKTEPLPMLPTPKPELLQKAPNLNGVKLVKGKNKQGRRDCPLMFAALDALYSQGHSINQDILALKNLPLSLTAGKNYALRRNAVAAMEEFKGEFFIKYTLDSRGRSYSRSRPISPQGDSFAKAAINFSEAKPLGEFGLQALMIHYAGVSGHDKCSFKERMKWARKEGRLKAYAMHNCKGDWISIAKLIEDKKHCFEEYAAAIDFWNALDSGIPTQYKSALVTHQDATNSGFQFGATLLADRKLAEEVNLTATQKTHTNPGDLYKTMAKNLIATLRGTDVLEKLPPVTRSFCKTPILVTGYGAGIKAVLTDIQKEHGKDENDEFIITDDILEELKPFMESALKQTASSMLLLTDLMRTLAEHLVEEGAESIEWITPDNFRVIHTYRDKSEREVKLNDSHVSYTKLPKGEKDPISQDDMCKALPPNFIHSMDAQMLRTAALAAKAAGIAYCPIHDSFGTHAATFFELNGILKQSFVETMSYDWFGEFCKHNNIKGVPPIQTGDYKLTECLKATYMFS